MEIYSSRTQPRQTLRWSGLPVLTLSALLFTALSCRSQQAPNTPLPFFQHGTCAVAAFGAPGMAFIVDSRVTLMRGDEVKDQFPGCKVRLARPTILVAGTGLADTTGRAGHWNSLDSAASALKALPDTPTADDIDVWGLNWARSLAAHFAQETEKPQLGVVSEVLLLTRIDGRPWFSRMTVLWDGANFIPENHGGPMDGPNLQYSGLCRKFVRHRDTYENLLPRNYGNNQEAERMDYWGSKKDDAKTVGDLAFVARELELMSTSIDERYEHERAVIAGPYATAEWANGAEGWTVAFNEECHPQNVPLVSAPGSIGNLPARDK